MVIALATVAIRLMAAWLVFTRLIAVAGATGFDGDLSPVFILHGGTILLATLIFWKSGWLASLLTKDLKGEILPGQQDETAIVKAGSALLGLYWIIASAPQIVSHFISESPGSMPVAHLVTLLLAVGLVIASSRARVKMF